MRNQQRFHSSVVLALALCAALGCQQSHGGRQAGSESHFLARCDADAECKALDPELSCQEGYCRSAPAEEPTEPAPAQPMESPPEEPAAPGTAQPVAGATAPEVPAVQPPLAAGCVSTGFPGDEFCLAQPSPEEGIQIHIGPSSYDDPAELTLWALAPGLEVEDCWSFHTPNATEFAYAAWESAARPGLHHAHQGMYAAEVADGQFEPCLDDFDDGSGQFLVATLPSAARTRIPRFVPAPENAGVARLVPAASPAQACLHHFNFTDVPLLRELWMNLYVPAQTPTEYERPLRAAGGMEWSLPPDSELRVTFACPIESSGRLLSLSGRTTASTLSLSARLRRGSSGDLVPLIQLIGWDAYDAFAFDSIRRNEPIREGASGAYTGMLQLEAGDTLEWDCHVFNQTGGTLTHDDHLDGAVCDLLGSTVGTDVLCMLP